MGQVLWGREGPSWVLWDRELRGEVQEALLSEGLAAFEH